MTPDEIPANVRSALLGELFGEWLDAVPTARDSWTLSGEEIAQKSERAEEISDRMDWLTRTTPRAPAPSDPASEGAE